MSGNNHIHFGNVRMMNLIFLVFFLSTDILSFISISSISSNLVSATPTSTSTGASLRSPYGNSTGTVPGRNHNDTLSYTSCNSLTTCGECTNTYTCHWCDKSESCHAKGSIHGCAWGGSCKNVTPPKKENTTCSSHTTCDGCSLSSHFCHWCEHDNACHAIGSRFGCAIGVDCYSNDRCRRSEPEPFPVPSSPLKAVVAALNRVPVVGYIVIAFLFILSFGCLSCCFFFVSNIKGAYDDLAEITIAASVAPISVIGDVRFTRLSDFPDEEEVLPEDGDESNNNDGDVAENDDDNNNASENVGDGSAAIVEQASQSPPQSEESPPTTPPPQAEAQNNSDDQQQQQQQTGESDSPYFLMDDTRQNSPNRYQLHSRENETGPLLHPSFGGSVQFEEPRHMKRLFRGCSALYYLSVIMLVSTVAASLFFYPQVPVYSICNDEVAWAKIMRNIVAFKFDASFEVLGSLSNPNRIAAALDRGKGSFSFEGKQFGTFEIPPFTADPMTITDFMLIVHISPADKTQAIQLAEAYYTGKLALETGFEGTIRLPDLFDYSTEIILKDQVVDINAKSDRSLCQCPTWQNHSTAIFPELMDG